MSDIEAATAHAQAVDQQVETDRRAVDVQRVIQHRAELFTQLSFTEGYQEMMRELERKEQRMRTTFAERLLQGEAVDQRQVDYDRGFIDALRYIPTVVKGAERTLERLDRSATAESEPDDNEEDNW